MCSAPSVPDTVADYNQFAPEIALCSDARKSTLAHLRALLTSFLLGAASIASLARGQASAPPAANPDTVPTIRVTVRSVVLDVIVTRKGKPVTGLKKDAFTVKESGKPQTISFFEESLPAPQPRSVQMPKMPKDVFTNFSPFPDPPAVNILLLDSLNTVTEDQSVVHKAALQFLKTAKPGNRMAIFTMGLGLHLFKGSTTIPPS